MPVNDVETVTMTPEENSKGWQSSPPGSSQKAKADKNLARKNYFMYHA